MMKKKRWGWTIGLAMVLMTTQAAMASVIMTDDFNRVGDLHGSLTSCGNFTWSELDPASAMAVDYRLNLNQVAGVAFIDDPLMNLADFELEFDHIYGHTWGDANMFVSYRMESGATRVADSGQTPGYLLTIHRKVDAIRLRLYKDVNAVVTRLQERVAAVPPPDWIAPVSIRLVVEGSRHKVFVGGSATATIDVTDTCTLGAGYWNFGGGTFRYHSVDNVVLIPEPATMILLGLGLVGLVGLKKKRA